MSTFFRLILCFQCSQFATVGAARLVDKSGLGVGNSAAGRGWGGLVHISLS